MVHVMGAGPHRASALYSAASSVASVKKFRLLAPEDCVDVNCDSLVQGGVVYSAKKWKTVEHVQAEGTAVLAEPAGPDYLFAWDDPCETQEDMTFDYQSDWTVLSYNAYKTTDGTFAAVAGYPAIVVTRTGSNTCQISFINSVKRADGGFDVATLATSRFSFDYPVKRDGQTWIRISSAWYGSPKLRGAFYSAELGYYGVLRQVFQDCINAGGYRAVERQFKFSADLVPVPAPLGAVAEVEGLVKSHLKRLRFEGERALTMQRHLLHAKAFDKLEAFDGNFALLLSKLPQMGTVSLKSIGELATSQKGIKDFASYWLANRYGDRLSVSGFKDLVESIDKAFAFVPGKLERQVICRTRRYDTVAWDSRRFDVELAVQIAVKPKDYNGLVKLVRTLMEWDTWPSMQNVWDAVPLSFVVDWFVNVGDIFESLDRMVQARYYDVACILETTKCVSGDPRFPCVRLEYYSRKAHKNLCLGVSSVELGLPSAINCISGAALLCGLL